MMLQRGAAGADGRWEKVWGWLCVRGCEGGEGDRLEHRRSEGERKEGEKGGKRREQVGVAAAGGESGSSQRPVPALDGGGACGRDRQPESRPRGTQPDERPRDDVAGSMHSRRLCRRLCVEQIQGCTQPRLGGA